MTDNQSEERRSRPVPPPRGARRIPTVYLVAIAAVVLIGVALIVFGGVRMEQSADRMGDTPSAFEGVGSPDEPAETGSVPGGAGAGPEEVSPRPGAIDVPGSD